MCVCVMDVQRLNGIKIFTTRFDFMTFEIFLNSLEIWYSNGLTLDNGSY